MAKNTVIYINIDTAAFHARVRGSFSGLGGLKETKMFLLYPLVKRSIVGSFCEQEVTFFNEVLLAQFSLYVHKSGLKPDSFHCLYKHRHISKYVCLWIKT